MNFLTLRMVLKKNFRRNAGDWDAEAESQMIATEWIGAVVDYYWHRGRRSFNSLYTREHASRNRWMGYLALFALVLLILCGFLLLLIS